MIAARYIAVRSATYAVGTALAILGGWASIDALLHLEDFLREWPDRWLLVAVRYYAWHLPGWAVSALPWAAFVGALAAAAEMRRGGEVDAMLPLGSPPVRLLAATVLLFLAAGIGVSASRLAWIQETERVALLWKEARQGRQWRRGLVAGAADGTVAWAGQYQAASGTVLQWISLAPEPGAEAPAVGIAESAVWDGPRGWGFTRGALTRAIPEVGLVVEPWDRASLAVRPVHWERAGRRGEAADPTAWLRAGDLSTAERRRSRWAWGRLWAYPLELALLALSAWAVALWPRRDPHLGLWAAAAAVLVAFEALRQAAGAAARLGALAPEAAALLALLPPAAAVLIRGGALLGLPAGR